MRVYISGPITDYADANRAEFGLAEVAIRSLGHDPVNPLTLEHNHGKTWPEYMKVDLVTLMECDAVLALKDWQFSRGAKIEIGLAVELGIPVYAEAWRLL